MASDEEKLETLLSAAKAMGLDEDTVHRLMGERASASGEDDVDDTGEEPPVEEAPAPRKRGRPAKSTTTAAADPPPERTGRAHGTVNAWEPADIPPL